MKFRFDVHWAVRITVEPAGKELANLTGATCREGVINLLLEMF